MDTIRTLACIVATFALSGCTHHFLQDQTTKQSATATDIMYQQVLDNIAMAHQKPGVLPYFSTITGGLTQAADSTGGDLGLEWDAFGIMKETLGFNADRQLTEKWDTSPLTVSDRLERMRCAYELVTQNYPLTFEATLRQQEDDGELAPYEEWALIDADPAGCSNCVAELVDYGLLPPPNVPDDALYMFQPERMAFRPLPWDMLKERVKQQCKQEKFEQQLDKEAGRTLRSLCAKNGKELEKKLLDMRPEIVAVANRQTAHAAQRYQSNLLENLACVLPTGWYGIACDDDDIPECATYIGEHEGLYVWVGPHGVDAFSRLTTTIVTIATTDSLIPEIDVQRQFNVDEGTVTLRQSIRSRKSILDVTQEEMEAPPGVKRRGVGPPALDGAGVKPAPSLPLYAPSPGAALNPIPSRSR